MLDRRLPCFHLLACPRACGAWLPRWRREGRNVRACEWCLDCLCRLAPCSSTERSAGNPCLVAVGWDGASEAGSCAPYPFRGSGPLAISLHPAPCNGRGRTSKHPPVFHRALLGRVAHGDVRRSWTRRTPRGGDPFPLPKRSSDITTYDGRARPLGTAPGGARAARGVSEECYLVDPASSHMLVSKIKPCMCKYELIQTVKLRMAH